jgi:hypothetical protein
MFYFPLGGLQVHCYLTARAGYVQLQDLYPIPLAKSLLSTQQQFSSFRTILSLYTMLVSLTSAEQLHPKIALPLLTSSWQRQCKMLLFEAARRLWHLVSGEAGTQHAHWSLF